VSKGKQPSTPPTAFDDEASLLQFRRTCEEILTALANPELVKRISASRCSKNLGSGHHSSSGKSKVRNKRAEKSAAPTGTSNIPRKSGDS